MDWALTVWLTYTAFHQGSHDYPQIPSDQPVSWKNPPCEQYKLRFRPRGLDQNTARPRRQAPVKNESPQVQAAPTPTKPKEEPNTSRSRPLYPRAENGRPPAPLVLGFDLRFDTCVLFGSTGMNRRVAGRVHCIFKLGFSSSV